MTVGDILFNGEFCSPLCNALSLTEADQIQTKKDTGNTLDHNCFYFNERLYHGEAHPQLKRADKCLNKDWNKRK